MNRARATQAAIAGALHAPTLAARREAAHRAYWSAHHDLHEARDLFAFASAVYRRQHDLPGNAGDADVFALADTAPWERAL